MEPTALLDRCAQAIAAAEGLLITAGAGMGVDSGLPDFRGTEGFWKAYPPYAKLGMRFEEMANPSWFRRDPPIGWGFYGHRFSLYRRTTPHDGFRILKHWSEQLPLGYFVFTSNVDHQFQRAGFSEQQIMEVHGSLDWLQCLDSSCTQELWPVAPQVMDLVKIDEATMRAQPPLPVCPTCGLLARPNVLMFGDWNWNSSRCDEQQRRFHDWYLRFRDHRLVVVECGAGKAVSTVRRWSEQMLDLPGATLIRINVRDPEVPPGQIGLALGAQTALAEIDRRLPEGLRAGVLVR